MIQTLTSKSNRSSEEDAKKSVFTPVLSADYQQAKLIPHWGITAQPGSTYYLQKVSTDVSGIVDNSQNIILFNERIGPKNTDHTVSLLQEYITEMARLHPWIRRVLRMQ